MHGVKMKSSKKITAFVVFLVLSIYQIEANAFCLFNCKLKKTKEQCEQENSELKSKYVGEYSNDGMNAGIVGTGSTAGMAVGAGLGAAAGYATGWWKGEDCSQYPSEK
jgi:hypothetical protein